VATFQNISGFDDLTSKQQQAIILLCDYEKDMSYKEVAAEVGITYRQLYNWRKEDDTFREVKEKAAELGLIDKLDKVNQKLVEGALDGDARLIKLYYERIGKYVERQEISGPDGDPIEVDAKAELARAINQVAGRKED